MAQPRVDARAKVVILCGGKGTRLHEETELKPKPMAQIGGRPILWHIMKIYAHAGFTDFVLCLGYKGDVIKKYFLDYDLMGRDFTITMGEAPKIEMHGTPLEKGWTITFAETGPEAMTGARLKRIEKYIDTKYLMLTYGDGVANLDVRKLFAFHKSHGKIGTVTGVRPPSRFGELLVDGDTVREFSEKPQTGSGFINGVFFVFDRRIFDYVEDNERCTFEGQPLSRLASDGELAIYKLQTFWQCMDTYRDLQMLNKVWETGHPEWRVWSH
ncbi:MAG: glucose-1-phosphate cytidylyltransferase [Planctomycetes bacterium]|nr:glucose-1-phosphate cytidylyltransferase [Planctomycetota bacterium]